jgi:hypothetical protein
MMQENSSHFKKVVPFSQMLFRHRFTGKSVFSVSFQFMSLSFFFYVSYYDSYYTIMPQAEWYNVPYFSVPPIGGRKVAKIKYNNRCAIIIT